MKHLLLLALLVAPSLALGRPLGDGRTPATVQVSAQAAFSQAPNRVYIDVGVRSEARQPDAAATENAARVAAVIRAVRKAAGPGARLTTTRYALAPQYQYHPDGKPPTLTGYAVTNVVQVRLDALKRIGAVIDAANAAGANMQQNLRFALRDPEAARLHALARAAGRARRAARALATALGLRIVRIVSVRQTGVSVGPPGPPRLYEQAIRVRRASVVTPIESGTIRVTANISLTVAVAPR